MWNIRFPIGNCTTTIKIIGWMVTEEHRNGKENGPRQERAPLLLFGPLAWVVCDYRNILTKEGVSQRIF